MKPLPQTRAGIIRSSLIFLAFAALVFARRPDRFVSYYFSDKAEGDILFQSLPRGDLVDAIEGISQSEWSHCGILVKRAGTWQVAEAIGEVRYTPLHLWLLRGRALKVEAYRVNQPPAPAVLTAALDAGVAKVIGRPYDFRYAPGDAEIYCSELVHLVYERELGISIGTWEKLGDLNWKPYEAFIRQMENGALPLDRLMVTPVALTRGPMVTRVFPR